MRLVPLLFLLLLVGCVADNESRQSSDPVTETHINVPPPKVEVKQADTDKIVEDTAARVSQNVKTDLAANQAQLSGHIVAQLHKLEANMKGLLNLEAKLENKMYADLRADLTSTVSAVAELRANFSANVTVTNKMDAKIDNQMKALSDIKTELGNVAGQADATVAAQMGLSNKLTKMQTTLQTDIKAGRDVNMWPVSAVITVLGIVLLLGGLIFGITAVIAKRAYDNARARQDNYMKLLMAALGDLEPHKAEKIRAQL